MINSYGEVLENASLKSYNTYGIDTTCDYLLKVDSIDNLLLALTYLKDNKIDYYILGKGSNVILPDNHFHGVIISLEKLNKVEINKNEVSAEAGITLGILAKECINNSLSGFEYLALIPGTLGGAIYGNAGVKDHDVFSILKSVKVIRDGKILELSKKDIDYDYRYTMFKDSNNFDIIVSATFELSTGNKDEMNSIISESRLKRMNSQPLEYKNAGSVFKNPKGEYAGKLIESVGLKGCHINDAEVSVKHANFIINKGNATSNDIKSLINLIKDRIYDTYNIELELEQIIVEWN